MKYQLNNFMLLICMFIVAKIFAEFPLEYDSCIQVPPDSKTIRQDIPEPYASLANWPLNMGTCLFRKANQDNLECFIKKYKPKTIVEVGSFLGVSAIFMASLMSEDGRLYAIDNWVWNGEPMYSDAHPQNYGYKLSKTYEQFLSNVKYFDLTHIIVPVHMDSVQASSQLNVIADLIYIDGDHGESSVYNDIMHWYPKLSKTGIMCGDDWGFDSVKKAVTRAAQELDKEIKTDHNFWYFVF